VTLDSIAHGQNAARRPHFRFLSQTLKMNQPM
jgi:hypothetical protein